MISLLSLQSFLSPCQEQLFIHTYGYIQPVHSFERNTSEKPWRTLFKFGTNVPLHSKTRFLEVGGQVHYHLAKYFFGHQSTCLCDISGTPSGKFFRFGTNIRLESRMNWYEFSGRSSQWPHVGLMEILQIWHRYPLKGQSLFSRQNTYLDWTQLANTISQEHLKQMSSVLEQPLPGLKDEDWILDRTK